MNIDNNLKVGDLVDIETTSGKLFETLCVKIHNNKIIFDDGITRLQVHRKTGNILILKKRKEVKCQHWKN